MTFNVFERNGGSFYNNKNNNKIKVIDDCKPNIICTQEDSYNNNKYDNINGYKSITDDQCGTKFETNGVYLKDDENVNEYKFIKCISTEFSIIKDINNDNMGSYNSVKKSKRSALIFGYQNLIIANIHLEGGRFVDNLLLNNFDKLMSYKIELLYKLLNSETKPDIIVGDFNSVYHSKEDQILNNFLEGQYNYFNKKPSVLTDDEKNNIKMWNLLPILYLKQNGYEQAIPENEDKEITNGRGNL
jgi:hypothetical protein